MTQFAASADMAAALITAQFGGVSATIEAPPATRERGHPTGDWLAVATTDDMIVEPIGGNERWQAQQAHSVATHRLTMPYAAGITTAMRVVIGANYYAIDAVRDVADAGVLLEIDAVLTNPRTT